VRQLILEGRLKSAKQGRDHLIQEADLKEYATELRKKTASRPKKDLRTR
jgi:hypothetical protein